MSNALSNHDVFLGDFDSKHKQFGCVKLNKSGQTLVNIAKDLKMFYVNQLGLNRHMRDDPFHGTSDILDMAFLSPGLSSRDISFSVADDHMGRCTFQILGDCQGRRTGVGVTTVSDSLILGGWVTKVLMNGDKK